MPIHGLPIALVLTAAVAFPAAGDELSGRQILDEVAKRHERPYEYEVQRMTLTDKRGNEEKREVRRFVRQGDGGDFKYLVVFLSPAGIKGVALLTWQHEGKDDDQFMFLPAYGKKMKRIAKGGRKNYFMGTDYAFEDLVSESRDKFTYERLADEACGDQQCFVLKAFPGDKSIAKESGYKYRQVWIRQDNYFLVRTDFFDKRGKQLKRQTNAKPVNVEGDLWRAGEITMEHFKRKHKTLVVVEKRSFKESDVPKKNFRQRFVTSGKHVR